MSSFLRINFNNQYFFTLKRYDPMRPMDLGEGPEHVELTVTIPRDSPDTTWNPIFGSQTLYTGLLSGGGTSLSVFIKWARSEQRMEELEKEGRFFCSALRKLHGVVVPNFYGYYTPMDHSLRNCGCMILERIDGNISSYRIDKRSKLEAAYRLHKAGVRHNGLHDQENFVTDGKTVYIVGFSEAKARCGCEMTKDRVRLCPELMWVEQRFGSGETNSVLKEIGVPPGWRVCLDQAP